MCGVPPMVDGLATGCELIRMLAFRSKVGCAYCGWRTLLRSGSVYGGVWFVLTWY